MQSQTSVFLNDYLAQWGGRLPFGTALGVLDNVLRELAAMHNSGVAYADVCPEMIYVSGNRAYLLNRGYASGNAAIRPGYTAPEQYRPDGRVGPWSDVYSAGAVLFRMITGANPPDATQRLTPGAASMNFGEAQADPRIQSVMAALALDPQYRPQSCAGLLAAFGMPDLAAIPPHGIPAGSAASLAAPGARRKWSAKKRAVVICSSVVAGLCLCAGGFFLYTDILYNQAVACITQQKDYGRAIDVLKGVLAGYKSSGNWMAYACAEDSLAQGQYYNARKGFESLGTFNHADGMLPEVDYLQAKAVLGKGDFAQAKDMFTALGSYKDSAQMILESDYQKASSQLQASEYDDAIAGFTQLSSGNYKDSGTMVLEAKYRKAIDINGKGDSKTAYKMFQALGAYKDSAIYLNNTADSIYNEGITLYRQGSYAKAKEDFTLISSYKRSADYLLLIEGKALVQEYSTGEKLAFAPDYTTTKALYDKLDALGDFEDAQTVRSSDGFIYFRLEGDWRGSGTYHFALTHTDTGWHTGFRLPWIGGKYFLLDRGIYVDYSDETVTSSTKFNSEFRFTFISENEVQVYCYKDGSTYTLTR